MTFITYNVSNSEVHVANIRVDHDLQRPAADLSLSEWSLL